ncbi:flagellar motor protein MotD [Oxalobacteraceae bacterium R-40]|uniref:Flagellar motor protein MotD n=1 Tax=Keguizhuia sedimenti TaxID=3064264 RepID=A0ABU1BRE0_9BURK|nr:flagellar motor protein MotD [Oxalobacteraceae bacterium R-40]
MARRRFDDDHENHERWLVSYADFITLLFAFFVVMYAISSVNENKYRILSESLGTAFSKPSGPPIVHSEPVPTSIVPPKPTLQERAVNAAFRREKEYMTGIARSILSVLQPLVSQGKVRVTQTARGVSVEINASVLFAPGEAKLSPESVQALTAVAKVLKDDDHDLRIEGHTDNIPIATMMFPSNWELSAVRASSVVRLFMENGIDEKRMTAVGHGSNQPLMTNDTPEGRQRNRRVQLMILSGLPEQVTEVPVEAGNK